MQKFPIFQRNKFTKIKNNFLDNKTFFFLCHYAPNKETFSCSNSLQFSSHHSSLFSLQNVIDPGRLPSIHFQLFSQSAPHPLSQSFFLLSLGKATEENSTFSDRFPNTHMHNTLTRLHAHWLLTVWGRMKITKRSKGKWENYGNKSELLRARVRQKMWKN